MVEPQAFGHPTGDPVEAGLTAARVEDLIARARREVDEGLLPACQIAVARNGVVVIDETIGAAEPNQRFCTYSVAKSIMAAASWLVIGSGLVERGTQVVDVVPEFDTNGKDAVTVEHLLTHTAGFPHAPFGAVEWEDRDRRLERFAQWRLDWQPGTQFEYHPTSAHWILAEVIERVVGTDYRAFIAEEVLGPLGIPTLQLGVPLGDQGDLTELVDVGSPPTAEEIEALTGIAGIDLEEVTQDELMKFNDPERRRIGEPAGGGFGRAADVAMLFQAMMTNPNEFWDADVLRAGTAEVLCELSDPMVGVAANRTLGLILAGDDGNGRLRAMGSTASGRTFGHAGAGGQIAWADPQTGISFCYMTNGLDANMLRSGARVNSIGTRVGALTRPVGQ